MPDTDRPILSPARRARRCLAGLAGCLVAATGAVTATEWTQTNVFLSSRANDKELIYFNPPLSTPGTRVTVTGTAADEPTLLAATPKTAPDK